MAKVDWITWKTDPSEIINPQVIIDKITDIFQNYNYRMTSIVYEGIKHELTSGGLDQESLNIVGISPAYENANSIISDIDSIKETIDKLKEEIYNSSQEQKKIEKQQLIEAIESKIEEEQRILDNTYILKDKIAISNNVLNIQDVLNIIDITKEKIKRLEERLEKARSL